MGSLLTTLLSFIVALAILIAVHEFGHFWVARKLGVKVLRFSIGFGKPLLQRVGKVDGTEYVLAAIPLGGYVKMLDEHEGEVAEHERHRAFNRQSLAVRSAVVVAGPAFNFLFAILAYWAIFVTGDVGTRPLVGAVVDNSPAAVAGFKSGDELLRVADRETPTWSAAVYALLAESVDREQIPVTVHDADEIQQQRLLSAELLRDIDHDKSLLDVLGLQPARPQLPAVIGRLVPGDPAERAGMQVGDEILRADDQPVADWAAWVALVRAHPEQPLQVQVQRDGTLIELEIVPKAMQAGEQTIGRIGAAVDVPDGLFDAYEAEVRYGPLDAVAVAMDKTWDLSILTLKVLGKMLIGEASVKNLSGPITIAQTAGSAASIGLGYFIKFLAIVSISLGVLNLLPIPVLDGGHLLYFLIEAVKGSPLSEQAMMNGQRIGLAMLAGMMGLAFYVDLSRLFG